MSIVYGLTDQGLVIKTRQVIRAEINAAIQRLFGASTNLTDGSAIGQLVAIFTDRIGEVWELTEKVSSSQDPDKAAKTALEAVCTLTGTFRPHAASSVVTLSLTGTSTTVVPAQSEFATTSTNKHFTTQDSVMLVGIDPVVTLGTYVIGEHCTNGGNVYRCTVAGDTFSTPFPPTTDDVIVDGTCTWTYVGPGAAISDADAVSVDLGPIVGARRDITKIVNSISGLTAVTNLEDASLGRLDAEDPELRELREAELGLPGSSPFDPLRTKLRRVSGVTSVTLFPNNTDVTDADGVPPHSVEALVRGGEDQAIFDALLANVAVGIGTHGNHPGSALTSQGTSYPEAFSRATEMPVFVRLSVVKDTTYPSDGDAQVKNAVVDFGAVQSTGRDADPSALASQAFKIQGVFRVPPDSVMVYTDAIAAPAAWTASHAYVATSGSRSVVTNDGGRAYICVTGGTSAGSGGPTGTGTNITDGTAHWYFLGNTISITSRQLATYTPDNVTVTSTTGVP